MGSTVAIEAPEEQPASGTGKAVSRLPRWPLLLLAGWVFQLVARLVLAAHRNHPVLIPDESGYLLAARLLSGGAAGDLSGRAFYRGGYALLISPAYWLSSDPATVYRLVILINSMVGASLFLLAFIALRRLHIPRVQAYLLATVTALLPSMLYYGQFAVTDAILPVVVLGWLLLVHSWISTERPGYGMAAGAVAAYCYCVHDRGAIIVVVHAGLLATLLWRRWMNKVDLASAANVLVIVSTVAWVLNDRLRAQLYPSDFLHLDGLLSQRLTSLDGLAWTISLTAGKIWYLIVSTWGVAGVGLIVTGAVALRPGASRATRATAWLVLATVAGIALATSAAVPDEGTVANLAYGRYLGCLAPSLFVAGAAFAVRGTGRAAVRAVAATAALAVTTAGIVWLHAGDRLTKSYFGVFDFPEICFLTWSWDHLRLWLATGLALALLAQAFLLTARSRMTGLALAAAVFVGLDLAVATVVTAKVTDPWSKRLESATSLAEAKLSPHDRVAIHYGGMPWRIWVTQAFQARNGLTPIDRNRRNTLPSDATLVIVPWDIRYKVDKSWPAAPANWRPVLARLSYTGHWVAWRRIS